VSRTVPAPALSELLCFDLYAASRAVTALYRPVLDELGLTYPQYLVLVVLARERTQTVGELAAALQLDYGTLTPLLRRLENNGVVARKRRVDDERSVSVSLTAAGRALSRRAGKVQDTIRCGLGMDEEQAQSLQIALRALSISALENRSGTNESGVPVS
jgi:DNA-binding MarR family transcriptional regulator